VESLLSREEGETDQQADRVGSTAAEAMLVVRFQACGQSAVREWKLEASADAGVSLIRVSGTRHADSGNPKERSEVKAFADAITVRDEQKTRFEVVGRDRISSAAYRIDAEPRLELQLVTEEIAQAEYLRRQRK